MPFVAIIKSIWSFITFIPELYKVFLSIKKVFDSMKKQKFDDSIEKLKSAKTPEEIKDAAKELAKHS
jgi:hypothetical protein